MRPVRVEFRGVQSAGDEFEPRKYLRPSTIWAASKRDDYFLAYEQLWRLGLTTPFEVEWDMPQAAASSRENSRVDALTRSVEIVTEARAGFVAPPTPTPVGPGEEL